MATTTQRLLATALATALTLPAPAHATTTPTTTPTHTTTYPGHTTSRYVPLGPATADHARDAGCTEARTGTNGVRILFFGTQETDHQLREPGTSHATTTPRAATTKAASYAHHWAQGFTDCRTGQTTATLALGVNNKDDGNLTGPTAGKQWATLVHDARQRSTTPAVTITGALDAEPAWSTPTWARGWIDAYTKNTTTPLHTANSADGCPTTGTAHCNNNWTLADVHHLAGGGRPTVHALPQIYRTDGIQARQWANISRWGHTHANDPLRFAGAMSQHTACQQRTCNNTDNTPRQAWTQLTDALNAHASTRIPALDTATDIRWP
ncbi:hypothetical protein OUQ99_15675 [Streptomonospora nanhaiensis]|uniref:SGNH hydrolase-type esterase domain-containing protein n=1 Tax=Streptomonospora nanhaiensis TaxID=1323731 RepID=A0ABY6YVJ6_9ACTN|nr:hypothetical protein [Streptomonospora nanhaiensis]WAE76425.1 hypothetical protein OUQ99_15675 [Streptomonospora nanhaiensis]